MTFMIYLLITYWAQGKMARSICMGFWQDDAATASCATLDIKNCRRKMMYGLWFCCVFANVNPRRLLGTKLIVGFPEFNAMQEECGYVWLALIVMERL